MYLTIIWLSIVNADDDEPLFRSSAAGSFFPSLFLGKSVWSIEFTILQ